jgi:hypothetical protein
MRSKWSLSGNESVRWFILIYDEYMMNDDMFVSYLFLSCVSAWNMIFRTVEVLGIRCAKPCWAVSKEVLDPGARGGGRKHVRSREVLSCPAHPDVSRG